MGGTLCVLAHRVRAGGASPPAVERHASSLLRSSSSPPTTHSAKRRIPSSPAAELCEAAPRERSMGDTLGVLAQRVRAGGSSPRVVEHHASSLLRSSSSPPTTHSAKRRIPSSPAAELCEAAPWEVDGRHAWRACPSGEGRWRFATGCGTPRIISSPIQLLSANHSPAKRRIPSSPAAELCEAAPWERSMGDTLGVLAHRVRAGGASPPAVEHHASSLLRSSSSRQPRAGEPPHPILSRG